MQQCLGQWTHNTRRQRLAQCAVLDSIRAPRLGLIVLCKRRCFRALKRRTWLARAVDAMFAENPAMLMARAAGQARGDAKFLDPQNALGAAHILRALVDKRSERTELQLSHSSFIHPRPCQQKVSRTTQAVTQTSLQLSRSVEEPRNYWCVD